MGRLFRAVAVGVAIAAVAAASAEAQLVISEFRVRGPNGANDEFVEIVNVSPVSHTVASVDGSSGYAIAASSGGVRFVIPNGTVIRPGAHFLGVNSVGYSLATHPAGVGATATADANWTTDIPDNAGIALFSTSNPVNFAGLTRLDAVGSASEANALFKEGTGYPVLTPFSIDYAWYRDLASGRPKDTDTNASDFLFVDTNGTSAGGGQRLGAPGPENSTSPVGGRGLVANLLDPGVAATDEPNLVRDFASDPMSNATFGTVAIRRTITNWTGAPVTRLRFRISELTTFPSPTGVADLRPNSSSAVTVDVGGTPIGVLGTTLEEPPSQPNGGGFNSSLGVDIASPLPTGASVSVQLRFGIQQTGRFRVCGNLEALPAGGGPLGQVGTTDGGATPAPCQQPQNVPPVNVALPTVLPDTQPKEGQPLSSSLGTWSDPDLIFYGIQWRRCEASCADIPGATSASYTPDAADVGRTLRVRIIATTLEGIAAADSAPTEPVLEGKAPAATAASNGAGKDGVLNVALTCPADETSCDGSVSITAAVRRKGQTHTLDLGSGSFSIAGGESVVLPIRLSKRGRALRRKGRSATMTVVVTDAAGNSATIEQTFMLKAPK